MIYGLNDQSELRAYTEAVILSEKGPVRFVVVWIFFKCNGINILGNLRSISIYLIRIIFSPNVKHPMIFLQNAE